MFKQRRNKIAGEGQKEDDEITLVGEEEENPVKELVETATLETEVKGGNDEVVKVVEKEVEDIKAGENVAPVKDVVS